MSQNTVFTRWWHQGAISQVRHSLSLPLWHRYFTTADRSLPDFLIAGAMKAGTTSLFGYLDQHPHCSSPLKKEVNYFDTNFSRGQRWYRMHFPRRTAEMSNQLCYEASPYYMCDPRVPVRIKQELPGVKIVFLLRNPVDRAYSHYQHNVRRRREQLSFEEAIAVEPDRLRGELERMKEDDHYESQAYRHYSYLTRGNYAEQLAVWQSHFSEDRLLVLQAEVLFRNPQQALARTLLFLGLEPWEPDTFGNLNPGRYRAGMGSQVRTRLSAHFEQHNQRLFHLLGTTYDWEN